MVLWHKYILDINAPTDVNAITQTVEWLFDELEKGAKNIDFTVFKAEHVNAQHLVTALRLAANFKTDVNGWDYGLKIAKIAIKKQNLDESDVLMGLQ